MLKKHLFLFFILVISISFAQEKNSLLWKISGNGLTKDSYLYGTMHVSQKIAFHLDDVFYNALLKSDFVGLESDPSTWLDHMFNSSDEMNLIRGFLNNNSDFYNSPFKLNEPKQREIMFYLSREDVLLNGILYRTNQMMQNFQEDTFLDMFIYQTGKKNKKKIFSLENFEESSLLVKKATLSSKARKSKPDSWLQKRMKDEGFLSLMNNAYRDRKVALLDSINQAMYSKSYMNNMLYIRNENMVNSIDSIVKKGSLFSAIGAAHLGGKKGVIEMLREKGYTVEALTSEITSKAEKAKKEIENKTIDVRFKEQTADDGFFTALLPNKMYELNILNNTSYISPDLTNGAYVIITRMNTFSKIHGAEIKNKNFDKLLYESIPGEIISKKDIVKQGIKGLDILNKTKTGNFQRYQIFFTPLEVLIFKMNGKNNYVKIFGDTFFNSIKFNNVTNSFITVSPKNKNFTVKVPSFHSFINKSYQGNRTIHAIDKENNYYFLREVTLNDISYIEEDTFELERIQERFYKNLELEYKKGNFETSKKRSFISNTKLKNGSSLFLKTMTNGSHYYLLGYISNKKDVTSKDVFFDSFKISNFHYKEDFTTKIDTSLYFSVKTIVKPSFNRYDFNKLNENKSYESFTKSTNYTNNANEKIFVKLNKLHDLASFDNVDSLWSKKGYSNNFYNMKRALKQNTRLNFNSLYFKNTLEKKNVRKGLDANGNHFYSYYLKDSLSSKAIKVKNILVQGAIYELKTLVDTVYSESKFVKEFYNSFKPKDTILGKPLFIDKTNQFFLALKNKDSIVLDGYDEVNFKKKHTKKLMNVLRTYEFPENQLKIKKYLIKELGKFKTKKVERFLNDLYIKSFQNPSNQITIINAILNTKSEKSYTRFLKLLESDVPLSSNKYQMNRMIESVGDSLTIAKNLFPELLNYTTIEEYKKPIYELLVELIDEKLINSSDYLSYKKQLLNQAKIELKRQLGKKSNENSYASKSDGDLLKLYVKLLFPFRKDKNVKTFFNNVEFIKNSDVKSTLIMLQIDASEKYNKDIFRDLVSNLSSRGVLYEKLHNIKKTSIFPEKYKNKEEIYKALLFKRNQKKELKDSIVFLESRFFEVSKTKFEIYFYKSKINKNSTQKYNKDWKMNYIIFEAKDDEISIKPINDVNNKNLDTTKPIEEIIDDLVEENKLKNRKRVNLNSRGRRNRMF
ncbi:TraB/GumN family protein [Polaribacter aquimarinus]|uniref:TraB/GumN family protein n=1 Tax=Polaribacter aquimarinus TaxID=2100726 RepID=A0A2U2JDC0_9FLAO|nr:TraB/GumN family protein [Polaribacter aquimarinus]PWG06353.1 TraB/GumN family protein [Polaribacter aquimarinus]